MLPQSLIMKFIKVAKAFHYCAGIFFYLFFGLSGSAQTLISDSSGFIINEGATLIIQNSLTEEKTILPEKTKVTVVQGATLIAAEGLINAEIVVEGKEQIVHKLPVKNEPKKTEFQVQIEEKVKETVQEKPKPKFFFHSLPSSETIAAGNILQLKIIPTTNVYFTVENTNETREILFDFVYKSKFKYSVEINSSLDKQRLWARPPPSYA